MKTCKEKAAEWGIAERTVTYFCNNNRILGAVKEKAGKFPMTRKDRLIRE